MSDNGSPAVEVEARVSDGGAVRVAKFVLRDGETVDAGELLSRIASALPEFEPVGWHMDYLPVDETPPGT
jgi:hypothetical protein